MLSALAAVAISVTLGTAGAPLDDSWTVYHDWRMKPAHMVDVGYMPTVWRNLGTEGEQIGEVIANDPHSGQLRYVQVLNEPDLMDWNVEYWADRYSEAYHEVKGRAQGATSVGGINLYWQRSDRMVALIQAIHERGAEVEWLGVHAYVDLDGMGRLIQDAQGLLGPVPVFITEAGHLWTDTPGPALDYMRCLATWVDQHPEMNIQRIYWFVTLDLTTPGHRGWSDDLSPGTSLYYEDGTLTPVGRAWLPAVTYTTWMPYFVQGEWGQMGEGRR